MRGRMRKPPAAARRACIVLAFLALLVTMLMLVLPRPAAAQAVRGQASLTTTGGYGRLVLTLAEEVDAEVRMSGGILVVSFKRPVEIPVDRINNGASDWIGAARRDPDGRGLRFALARKFKINSMAAGERLFIDLLPDSWTAAPPGLPQEVVEELARRARDAERIVRQQQQRAQQRKIAPIRVRVAIQPTFTRYVFELPELTGVSTERGKDKLALSFAAPLRFDLAEAKLSSPPGVEAIEATPDTDMTTVSFAFSKQVDVRTFREDLNYVVDVSPIDPKSGRNEPNAKAGGMLAGAEPPETKPASDEPKLPPAATMPNVGEEPGQPAGEKPAIAAAKPPAAPSGDAVPPAAAPPAAAAERDPTRPVAAALRRHGDNLRVTFPFGVPTPAAVFQRADTLWLVFDTPATLDVAMLASEPSRTIRSAAVTRSGDAQVLRLKLERPRLASLMPEGTAWTVTIGEAVAESSKPLGLSRNIVGASRISVIIPFDDPRALHWLNDPDIGDTLMVITGLGPARGFVKTQEFVEFRALASTHGVVVQRVADDLTAELSADKVVITRPGGLTLSEAGQMARRTGITRAITFDSQLWGFDRNAGFTERQFQLISAAADAPPNRRTAHRIELARFYLSREMFAEAKAVLDVTVADDRPTANDPTALVLRAVANIMLGRADAALKDLGNPAVGNQNDAQLWRALAYARQGRWAEARDGFRNVETAMGTLPLELQRLALKDSLRASIEVGDFASAAVKLNDFETVGVPRELEPPVSVLTGRLAEGLGRNEEALASYRFASESWHRPAAAQGRLREIALRYALGDAKKPDVINDLETLTTTWRGDETEIEALQVLARLYTEENRYRDAFAVMRAALTAHPNSDLTRRIQDGAAVTFDSLFLAGKGDTMPAIDALSLFYDFRELTPVGRRGDEMIRRLADRLVSVDLLDQAAELLQHQVDHRLQGAARAQVATRLAVIYLLNHKPDKAQATLRATRTADVSNEVRNQRMLIEARALSDLGRHDLAIEVIANIEGREAVRLRSDILWAARRWQLAAEQIELMYGDRWRDFQPLTDAERSDIMRAAVGFALAEDVIGTARLREKYAAKMTEAQDRRAFTVITGGLGTNSAEFRDVARSIAAVDTLEGFLRDLRARYPEMSSLVPHVSGQPADAPAPAKPERDTTGSITPEPKPAPKRRP